MRNSDQLEITEIGPGRWTVDNTSDAFVATVELHQCENTRESGYVAVYELFNGHKVTFQNPVSWEEMIRRVECDIAHYIIDQLEDV